MTLPYNTGFPTTSDSLGTTQAKFFSNTQSVKDFVNVNHFDFGNVLYGNHKWVWYGRLTSDFPDTSTPSNLAVATYGASDGTRTQLWFQPSNDATGSDAVQLTAGDVTQANFAASSGWTFLPGNLLMQWGKVTNAASGTVTYPVSFSAPAHYISTSPYFTSGNPSGNVTYGIDESAALVSASFKWERNGSTSYAGFYWTAIGPA